MQHRDTRRLTSSGSTKPLAFSKATKPLASLNSKKASVSGFTLIEVIIALGIVAGVVFLGYGSLNAAILSNDVTEDALQDMENLDRTWQLLEQDMRNVTEKRTSLVNVPCEAGFCTNNDPDYKLKFVRGGRPNPLNLRRSHLYQVGYRWEDEKLYRDTWSETKEALRDDAQSMRLLKKVTDFEMKFLPTTAKTLVKRSWRDKWPQVGGGGLPAAMEITMEVKGFGRMTRVFAIEDNSQEVAQTNNGNQPPQGGPQGNNPGNNNSGNNNSGNNNRGFGDNPNTGRRAPGTNNSFGR